ncbi:MAG: hypothetical protein AAAB16_07110 [Pseudomonas sp.]|uniref:hypothetical protein n=1 Tax=Pseudomonas sp. TaxID=306 RepID=UPI0030F09991
MKAPRLFRASLRLVLPSFSALLLAQWAALPAQAAMFDLGLLPNGILSHASAVSGDGKVVVGLGADAMNAHWLFRWTEDKGMVSFANFSGLGSANAVSGDGSVVVGMLRPGGVQRAFRWDAGGGFVYLGTLGGVSSSAWDISRDGQVIVGESTNATAVRRAFRWTAASGMQDLGGLTATGASIAYGVSGDGAVVVGTAASSNGVRAVRWQGGSVLDLGVLSGSSTSGAFGVNGDGSVVVGTSGSYAFRWTAAGGMADLGSLGGMSAANAVSADGAVVVGYSTLADGTDRAFRWTAGTGMTSLGLLNGGTYSEASAISDDGSVIVGRADNGAGERAVIWKDLVLQDLENLQHSVLHSADSSAQLMLSQDRFSHAISELQCMPGAEQRYCMTVGSAMAFADDGEPARQAQGLIGAGIRLDPHISIGGTLALGDGDGADHEDSQHHQYGLGAWVAYQQNAETGMGWGAIASLAASTGDSEFQRGEHLANVQPTATRVTTTANEQRLALSYGIALGQSLLTPELALYHVRSQRGAFEERNVALPLRVTGARSDDTYASATLRSATPLSERASLHLSLGVDALLSEQRPDFKGASNIPGLQHFAVSSGLQRRQLVPAATVGYRYALSKQASVAGQVQMAASSFTGQTAGYGLGVEFRYAF